MIDIKATDKNTSVNSMGYANFRVTAKATPSPPKERKENPKRCGKGKGNLSRNLNGLMGNTYPRVREPRNTKINRAMLMSNLNSQTAPMRMRKTI
jgi:hypothetical protein